MQLRSKQDNIAEVDRLMESMGSQKAALVDRLAIYESVEYLRGHGFDEAEIERCLVRYFYIDLDLLNEALTRH